MGGITPYSESVTFVFKLFLALEVVVRQLNNVTLHGLKAILSTFSLSNCTVHGPAHAPLHCVHAAKRSNSHACLVATV